MISSNMSAWRGKKVKVGLKRMLTAPQPPPNSTPRTHTKIITTTIIIIIIILMLFCLALVPLTSELATSGYGYKILNTSAPISNLFYMDDLKLYSKNDRARTSWRTENSERIQ